MNILNKSATPKHFYRAANILHVILDAKLILCGWKITDFHVIQDIYFLHIYYIIWIGQYNTKFYQCDSICNFAKFSENYRNNLNRCLGGQIPKICRFLLCYILYDLISIFYDFSIKAFFSVVKTNVTFTK